MGTGASVQFHNNINAEKLGEMISELGKPYKEYQIAVVDNKISGKYLNKFIKNKQDFDILMNDLGVTNKTHRNQLLLQMEELGLLEINDDDTNIVTPPLIALHSSNYKNSYSNSHDSNTSNQFNKSDDSNRFNKEEIEYHEVNHNNINHNQYDSSYNNDNNNNNKNKKNKNINSKFKLNETLTISPRKIISKLFKIQGFNFLDISQQSNIESLANDIIKRKTDRNKKYDCFINYRFDVDANIGMKLYNSLISLNISVFLDETCLDVNYNWKDGFLNGIITTIGTTNHNNTILLLLLLQY